MSKETKLAYGVMALTALLVVVFHALTFDYPSGWPFVIFLWLLIGGMIVFRAGIESEQNIWSYLFLGPVALVSIAQILYANPVARGPGDLIALVSAAFFAYWLFAPKNVFG
jgi:peptidoglycan/LPS O-acetylase OafA/YrhL